jgi:nucleotidyltransferase/DNA polymerase involved in DNA repair
MKAVGIATVGDLYRLDLPDLENHFGNYGARLYELARGIDHNSVVPNRVSKSISAEDMDLSQVRAICEAAMREYGTPARIRTEKGASFAGTGPFAARSPEASACTRLRWYPLWSVAGAIG